MKRNLGIITGVLLAALLLVFAVNRPAVVAQTPVQSSAAQRSISVSGSGTALVTPDLAVVVVGVRTEGEEASAAMDQNSEQVNDLISALRGAGIAQADIQTQNISLSPRYSNQTDASGNLEVTGYIAVNTVQATIRDLDQVGAVLDTAVDAGGNLIDSIYFDVSDKAEALQQAREAAYENASQKAQQLAELAGVQLGVVVSITETSFGGPQPFGGGVARELAQDLAVPVEAGSQSIQVDLQVTWEITGGTAGVRNIPVTGTATATRAASPTAPAVVSTATATATEAPDDPNATPPVVDITPIATEEPSATPGG